MMSVCQSYLRPTADLKKLNQKNTTRASLSCINIDVALQNDVSVNTEL